MPQSGFRAKRLLEGEGEGETSCPPSSQRANKGGDCGFSSTKREGGETREGKCPNRHQRMKAHFSDHANQLSH